MTELPLPPNDNVPPIERQHLKLLFDHLDRPNPEPCNHTFRETIGFLKQNSLPIEETLEWLRQNGAFCDCEAIYNTEAEWGPYSGRNPA